MQPRKIKMRSRKKYNVNQGQIKMQQKRKIKMHTSKMTAYDIILFKGNKQMKQNATETAPNVASPLEHQKVMHSRRVKPTPW